MASRRMLSRQIINSARFIKMPPSTQTLYFHLAINADDDGVVEAFGIMRMLNCSEDDIKILVAKEFVQVLNDDLVTYIIDWLEHNTIRPDRQVNSIYRDLLIRILPDVKLVNPTLRSDTKAGKKALYTQPEDNQMTDNGQSTDSNSPLRIGKDRLGKDRLGKVSIESKGETCQPVDNSGNQGILGLNKPVEGILKCKTCNSPMTYHTNNNPSEKQIRQGYYKHWHYCNCCKSKIDKSTGKWVVGRNPYEPSKPILKNQDTYHQSNKPKPKKVTQEELDKLRQLRELVA